MTPLPAPETTESVLPRRPAPRHVPRHRAPSRTTHLLWHAPAMLGVAALITAAAAGAATSGPRADLDAASLQPLADDSAGDGSASIPLRPERVLELRGGDAASRSDVRTTPSPTPSVTAAPTTPTTPAIVGTFAPLPGCTATVPAETPANGQLRDSDLCSIGDGHQLRADAAATFVAMDAAYAAEFGVPISITDSYRSYGSQQSLYGQKPNLAARPGTSNHGWGVAVDVFGGIDDYDSAQHLWLAEHGPDYGWTNPGWAQAGGSRPEPWHWEFDPALLG